MLHKLGNYNLFLLSNAVLSLTTGLFTPFWMIFVKDIGGGVEQFGFAIGLMVLVQSVTSYFVGKHSDQVGKKIYLILSGFALAAVVVAYTFVTQLVQLYIIQILM